MTKISSTYVLVSIASGLAWGLLAWGLWPYPPPNFGAWVAVCSPLIGFVIGFLFLWLHRLPPLGRIFGALASLYAAALMFGLVVGGANLAKHVALGNENIVASAVVLEGPAAAAWGVTFTGYLAILWPLACLNHEWLRRIRLGPNSES